MQTSSYLETENGFPHSTILLYYCSHSVTGQGEDMVQMCLWMKIVANKVQYSFTCKPENTNVNDHNPNIDQLYKHRCKQCIFGTTSETDVRTSVLAGPLIYALFLTSQ